MFAGGMRVFCVTTIVCLPIVPLSLLTAQTPSGGSVAEAKQHYENAVGAISQGDWTSAKVELLQAERLAPQNALIHYDLAVAYSHTGEASKATAEIAKALQIGLPIEQKAEAEKLRERLAKASPTVATASTPASHRSSHSVSVSASDAKKLHAMNHAVQVAGATSSTYRPGGFTLETSTGRLWWTRVTDSVCKAFVAEVSTSARLSDLNANIVRKTQQDGTVDIILACPNHSACMQNWAYDACQPMDSWKWRLGTNDYPEAVDVFDKTQKYTRTEGTRVVKDQDHGPLNFLNALDGIHITLVDDTAASDELSKNLTQLILAHGGKEESEQDEAQDWLIHHRWKYDNEEHSTIGSCRTTNHSSYSFYFDKDGKSFDIVDFFYYNQTCLDRDVATCRVDYTGHLVGPPLPSEPPSVRFEATQKSVLPRCTSAAMRNSTSVSGTIVMTDQTMIRVDFDGSEGGSTVLKRLDQ